MMFDIITQGLVATATFWENEHGNAIFLRRKPRCDGHHPAP